MVKGEKNKRMNTNEMFENLIAPTFAEFDKKKIPLSALVRKKVAQLMKSKKFQTVLLHEVRVNLQAKLKEKILELDPSEAQQATQKSLFLERGVENLGLSVRAWNCLGTIRIDTVGQLTQATEEDLRKSPNLGDGTLQEIKEKLALKGLKLKE